MFALKFKRGASFIFVGPIMLNGAVQNMTGWGIQCSIREHTQNGTVAGGVGYLIANLPAVWLDPATAVAQIGSNAIDTSGWPLIAAVIDIKLTTPGGAVVMTPTQKIQIEAAVTE